MATCAHPTCLQPAYPGSEYCSRSHRDAPRVSSVDASPKLISALPPCEPPRASGSAIKFYDSNEPYYELTNFALYSIIYDGKEYATSEHLFQSLKFEDQSLAEKIRIQTTSREAFEEAHKLKDHVRDGWYDKRLNVLMMEKVLLLKFTQHPKLQRMLLDTHGAELVEDSPHDPFWGVGADGFGENQLGIGLMKIRRILGILGPGTPYALPCSSLTHFQ